MSLESTRPPDDPLDLSATGLRPPQIRASHLEKRASVYARQSTTLQVREHTGSTAAQRELVNIPRRWGWPESRIEVIADATRTPIDQSAAQHRRVGVDLDERVERLQARASKTGAEPWARPALNLISRGGRNA